MNVKGEARNTEKNMNTENDFSEPRSGFSFPAMELFDDKDYESEEELAWGEGFFIDDDGHWVPLENRYEYFDLFCDDGYSDDCFVVVLRFLVLLYLESFGHVRLFLLRNEHRNLEVF